MYKGGIIGQPFIYKLLKIKYIKKIIDWIFFGVYEICGKKNVAIFLILYVCDNFCRAGKSFVEFFRNVTFEPCISNSQIGKNWWNGFNKLL